MPEPELGNLELINRELSDRAERLSSSGTRVDTKAALVAGAASTVGPYVAAHVGSNAGWWAASAYGAFLFAFACAVMAYRVRTFDELPTPRQLVNRYARRREIDTLQALVATRVEVLENNADRHRRKVRWWSRSAVGLAAAVALSAVAIIVET